LEISGKANFEIRDFGNRFPDFPDFRNVEIFNGYHPWKGVLREISSCLSGSIICQIRPQKFGFLGDFKITPFSLKYGVIMLLGYLF
jgi:hypothetical protein